MTWEVLSMIGTIAFAVSGAIVAMEEEYDILGVYILGIVTAFGGGAIRNLINRCTCFSPLGPRGIFPNCLIIYYSCVFISKQSVQALGKMGEPF